MSALLLQLQQHPSLVAIGVLVLGAVIVLLLVDMVSRRPVLAALIGVLFAGGGAGWVGGRPPHPLAPPRARPPESAPSGPPRWGRPAGEATDARE